MSKVRGEKYQEGVGERTWIREVKEKQKGTREEVEKVEDRAGETGRGREKGWRGRNGRRKGKGRTVRPLIRFTLHWSLSMWSIAAAQPECCCENLPTHTTIPSRHITTPACNTISTSMTYDLRIWTEPWKHPYTHHKASRFITTSTRHYTISRSRHITSTAGLGFENLLHTSQTITIVYHHDTSHH